MAKCLWLHGALHVAIGIGVQIVVLSVRFSPILPTLHKTKLGGRSRTGLEGRNSIAFVSFLGLIHASLECLTVSASRGFDASRGLW